MDIQALALSRLSQALLDALGRHGQQGDLLEVLRQCGLDSSSLLRQGPIHPYPVSWLEQGLTVQMQHLKPSASAHEPEQDGAWGLHSMTLEAGRWPGPWPGGLNPDTVNPGELAGLLTPGKAPTLCTPDIVCLNAVSQAGRPWAAVALFEPASGKLQSLTLVRHGDWVAAPAPVQSNTDTGQTAEPPERPVTCSSGAVVTKTGWYEARLPDYHPQQADYSRVPERFAYCKQGQRMPVLGVEPPEDEINVVWTWRAEQKPE